MTTNFNKRRTRGVATSAAMNAAGQEGSQTLIHGFMAKSAPKCSAVAIPVTKNDIKLTAGTRTAAAPAAMELMA